MNYQYDIHTIMSVELLDYQEALARCDNCSFADPLSANNSGNKFVVGCIAPVIGRVVAQRQYQELNLFTETWGEVDTKKVEVDLVFEPEQRAVCDLYLRGRIPNDSVCGKAIAAKDVEDCRTRVVFERENFDPQKPFMLKYKIEI